MFTNYSCSYSGSSRFRYIMRNTRSCLWNPCVSMYYYNSRPLRFSSSYFAKRPRIAIINRIARIPETIPSVPHNIKIEENVDIPSVHKTTWKQMDLSSEFYGTFLEKVSSGNIKAEVAVTALIGAPSYCDSPSVFRILKGVSESLSRLSHSLNLDSQQVGDALRSFHHISTDQCCDAYVDIVLHLVEHAGDDNQREGTINGLALKCVEHINVAHLSSLLSDELKPRLLARKFIDTAEGLSNGCRILRNHTLTADIVNEILIYLASSIRLCQDYLSPTVVVDMLDSIKHAQNYDSSNFNRLIVGLSARVQSIRSRFSPNEALLAIGGISLLQGHMSSVCQLVQDVCSNTDWGSQDHVEFSHLAGALAGMGQLVDRTVSNKILKYICRLLPRVVFRPADVTGMIDAWIAACQGLNGCGRSTKERDILMHYLVSTFERGDIRVANLTSTQLMNAYSCLKGASSSSPSDALLISAITRLAAHNAHVKLSKMEYLNCLSAFEGLRSSDSSVVDLLRCLVVNSAGGDNSESPQYLHQMRALRGLQNISNRDGSIANAIVRGVFDDLERVHASPPLAESLLFGLQEFDFDEVTEPYFVAAIRSLQKMVMNASPEYMSNYPFLYRTLLLACEDKKLITRKFPSNLVAATANLKVFMSRRSPQDDCTQPLTSPNSSESSILKYLLQSLKQRWGNRIQLEPRQFLHGFEADIVIRLTKQCQDGSNPASEIVINVEIDGPSHDTPKSSKFCELRDRFLTSNYGIRVVRFAWNVGEADKRMFTNEVLRILELEA